MTLAGIKANPKTNRGFNIIFKKKVKIKTFLNDFVSPFETKKELIVNCKKNREAPKKIMFI